MAYGSINPIHEGLAMKKERPTIVPMDPSPEEELQRYLEPTLEPQIVKYEGISVFFILVLLGYVLFCAAWVLKEITP